MKPPRWSRCACVALTLILFACASRQSARAQAVVQQRVQQPVRIQAGGAPTREQVLAAIRALPPRREISEQDEAESLAESGAFKEVAGSADDAELPAKKSVVTPPLSAPEFNSLTGGNDPQIAVGYSWFAVTGYNRVAFYKKGETTPTAPGDGLTANPIGTRQLFAWLISPVNSNNANYQLAGMGIPASDCDPAGKGNTTQCINDIYDVRVRYDRVSKQFFILAHTRPGLPGDAPDSEKAKRRSFNFLAVSNAEDPHQGFHYFFWPEVVDEGICSVASQCPPGTPYIPGQAADYQTFTVNDPYPVEADNVKGTNSYQIIHIIPLASLRPSPVSNAEGQTANQATEIQTTIKANFKGAFDDLVKGGLHPVERLGGPGGTQYLVRSVVKSDGEDGLEIFWFKTSPPFTLHSEFVKTKAFGAAIQDPAMPNTTSLLRYDNMGRSVPSAVIRDGRLWAVFQNCRLWAGAQQCSSAIHLVEVDLGGAKPAVLKDRIFGKHSADDNAADPIVGYGNPGVMVTKNGDAVVVYNRSNSKVYPEARYSVWPHNEPDIRPSSVLQAGNASAPPSSKPAVWNIDTAGIAIDPADDATVWMAHDFATNPTKPTVRMAIGRLTLP